MTRFPSAGEDTSIMGIINLSRNSFYEASRCETLNNAIDSAKKMVEEGADIIDIGAESSRPFSEPISEGEELDLLLPVITELTRTIKIPISVDTYKPAVAQKVLDKGVQIINDITGLQRFPEMAKVVAYFDAGMILMHMQGSPKVMQNSPQYNNVMDEVFNFLKKSIDIAASGGIDPDRIALDPGIGFGKTDSHNLTLLKKVKVLASLKKPLLLGLSRKSLIGNILKLPIEDRLSGSIAAALYGVMQGASIIRTHDVLETKRAIKVVEAIRNEKGL